MTFSRHHACSNSCRRHSAAGGLAAVPRVPQEAGPVYNIVIYNHDQRSGCITSMSVTSGSSITNIDSLSIFTAQQ